MESRLLELIDTHCHLDFEVFDDDRETIIKDAQLAGVTCIINPGVDVQSSEHAIKLSTEYGCIYSAVGIHPNSQAIKEEIDWYSQLKKLASHQHVVALGEIGLDYYRMSNPIDYQKQLFTMQLNLAKELNLPVIIHNREAGDDVMEILLEWITQLKIENSHLLESPGVLHSFSEDINIAQKAIDMGFYLGISGPITFNNAKRLQTTVSKIPLNHLLLETDAPFLTPHPYRGKRNEPAYIINIANKVAELHNLSLERVIEQTTLNAKKVFRLRDRT